MMRSAMTASSSESARLADVTAVLKTTVTRAEADSLGSVKSVGEIVQPDEFGIAAERVLDEDGLLDRLPRRPDEEDQRDGDLRRHQQIGQQHGAEDDALVSWHPRPRSEAARRASRRMLEARTTCASQHAWLYLLARFELAQATRCRVHRLVERGFGVLLAGPHRFELLVHRRRGSARNCRCADPWSSRSAG